MSVIGVSVDETIYIYLEVIFEAKCQDWVEYGRYGEAYDGNGEWCVRPFVEPEPGVVHQNMDDGLHEEAHQKARIPGWEGVMVLSLERREVSQTK